MGNFLLCSYFLFKNVVLNVIPRLNKRLFFIFVDVDVLQGSKIWFCTYLLLIWESYFMWGLNVHFSIHRIFVWSREIHQILVRNKRDRCKKYNLSQKANHFDFLLTKFNPFHSKSIVWMVCLIPFSPVAS